MANAQQRGSCFSIESRARQRALDVKCRLLPLCDTQETTSFEVPRATRVLGSPDSEIYCATILTNRGTPFCFLLHYVPRDLARSALRGICPSSISLDQFIYFLTSQVLGAISREEVSLHSLNCSMIWILNAERGQKKRF